MPAITGSSVLWLGIREDMQERSTARISLCRLGRLENIAGSEAFIICQ